MEKSITQQAWKVFGPNITPEELEKLQKLTQVDAHIEQAIAVFPSGNPLQDESAAPLIQARHLGYELVKDKFLEKEWNGYQNVYEEFVAAVAENRLKAEAAFQLIIKEWANPPFID